MNYQSNSKFKLPASSFSNLWNPHLYLEDHESYLYELCYITLLAQVTLLSENVNKHLLVEGGKEGKDIN